MTTQAVTATVGNNRMSKIFGGTITDGVWTNIEDTLSETNLGILIPRATISNISANYTAGLAAYRLQNAQSLAVSRTGWASKDGYSCYKSAHIRPVSISPDDMIQVYSMPKAGSGKTHALAWVHTTKGVELYKANDVAAATATPMITALQEQSFGDAAFGSTLTGVSICLQDGANLDKVEFIDSAGGVVLTINGNHRNPSADGAGVSAYYNLDVTGLGLEVTKGFKMQITVNDNQ